MKKKSVIIAISILLVAIIVIVSVVLILLNNKSVSVNFTIDDKVEATIEVGEGAVIPTIPPKEGYTLSKWYFDKEYKEEFSFEKLKEKGLEGDVSVYAKWIPNEYIISFEENGGSIVDDIPADFGTSVTKPTDPTRVGYTFGGWFTDNETFLNAFIFDTMPLDGTTVYAKWLETYDIVYNLDGGTNNELNPNTYTIEDEITFASPTKLGYTFIGWFDSEINGTQITKIALGSTGDKTIYARWSINQYTIQFEENGGSTVEDITADFGASVIKPTDPARAGYTFGGWFTDNEVFANEFVFSTMPLDGATVYAKWIVNGYTITFEENGGSTVDDIIADFGASVTKPTDPTKGGYTFVGWFTDNNTFANEFEFNTMPLDGTTVYAKWDKKPSTEGLSYAYNSDLDGYVVRKDTADTSGKVVIAELYDDGRNGEKPVKSIGSSAFYGCSSLTSITIPNSVTSIGSSAFQNCSGLTGITIPDSVTGIGSNMFSGCRSLTSVTIGNSVTSIGSEAFNGCSGLTSIAIPSSVTSIGNNAFKNTGIWNNAAENGVVYADKWAVGYKGTKDAITKITLKSDTVGISSSAFSGCSSLTNITIPDRVTGIGFSAFYGCSSLTSIVIPDGVTSIGQSAFYGCIGLTSVTIGNGVTSIGSSAFRGCSSLTSITIPNSVTSIGSSAFYGCSSLTSVTIGNSVTSIGSEAFYGCSGLTSIAIPSSVTSIGNSAFYGCSGLTSIAIPSSVTSIGNSAFSNCSSLTSIVVVSGNTKYHSEGNCLIETATKTLIAGCNTSIIPTDGSVTSIGSSAFRGCSSLTSITIPDSVTSIGSSAFRGCSSLTSITLPFVGESATATGYERIFGYIFGYTTSSYSNPISGATYQYSYGSTYYHYYIPTTIKTVVITGDTSIGSSAFQNCSSLTSITIPNSVTSIGSSAFSGCSSLTSITIPNSVTSIGSSEFSGCSSLTSIVVASGNTKYHSEGNCLIETATKTLIAGCKTSIIPTDGSVTSIGDSAFSGCSSLTSIVIPDSVTSIGSYAFRGCSGLTSIIIPNSVIGIGSYAFSGCSGLTIYVEVASKPSGWNSSWNSNCPVVWDCNNSEIAADGNIYYIADNGIRYALKDGVATVRQSTTLSGDIEIPSIITYKGISYTVTSIDSDAFYGCSSLTSITIPDSVTSIGSFAFRGCSSLTSITLPFVGKSATATGYESVFGCIFGYTTSGNFNPISGATCQYSYGSTYYHYYIPTTIKTVVITGDTSIGSDAFQNCSSLTSITIPNSVTSIGSDAFYGCSSLTSVSIPNSVTSIGYQAFSGCSSLTSIVIPDSATSIGNSAFSGCSSLTSITIPDSVTHIDSYAFSGCSSLTSITIPSSVIGIGSYAFSGCSSLTSIQYNGTKTQWNAITKGRGWNSMTGAYTIYCTDGNISK